MAARRAFRIGSWIALAAGTLVPAIAVTTAVVGVLVLTGKAAYPTEVDLGPLHFRSTISVPAELGGDVCQKADITAQKPNNCFEVFLLGDHNMGSTAVRRQNPDVRLSSAHLTGDIELAAPGGWNSLVATIVANAVIGLALISAILLLVWRLLAAAASGEPFTARTVRQLRAIGWLVIVGALIAPALGDLMRPGGHGYTTNVTSWPELTLRGGDGYPGGLDFAQLALGALILLVAEVFRHGATLATEHRAPA